MIATGKDADSNAGTNFNLFKDKIDPLVLVHYGGGFTNNASVAAKERNLRFDKVIERAKGIDNPNPSFPIQGDFEFGAQRLIVDLGDGFHIDNLAVAHAKAWRIFLVSPPSGNAVIWCLPQDLPSTKPAYHE